MKKAQPEEKRPPRIVRVAAVQNPIYAPTTDSIVKQYKAIEDKVGCAGWRNISIAELGNDALSLFVCIYLSMRLYIYLCTVFVDRKNLGGCRGHGCECVVPARGVDLPLLLLHAREAPLARIRRGNSLICLLCVSFNYHFQIGGKKKVLR